MTVLPFCENTTVRLSNSQSDNQEIKVYFYSSEEMSLKSSIFFIFYWPRLFLKRKECLFMYVYCALFSQINFIFSLIVRKIKTWRHTRSQGRSTQGTNARNVISEVYAFYVLQCTVFGRKSKHKTDVTAWHGIHFIKNNL